MFDVFVRFSVFVLSCDYVEALQRADHPSKESYRLWMIKKLKNQPYAPKWEQAPKWEKEEVKRNINVLTVRAAVLQLLHTERDMLKLTDKCLQVLVTYALAAATTNS
jgi:hypothetical protein